MVSKGTSRADSNRSVELLLSPQVALVARGRGSLAAVVVVAVVVAAAAAVVGESATDEDVGLEKKGQSQHRKHTKCQHRVDAKQGGGSTRVEAHFSRWCRLLRRHCGVSGTVLSFKKQK